MSNDKLTIKDSLELTIQAGINAIPIVGGSLATIYFGAKQERRFKRIEKFYKAIKDEFDKIRDDIKPIEEQSSNKLASIIEEINEGVERDITDERIHYFKNCFFNTLTEPDDSSFGKRKYFINLLSILSNMDITILVNLYKSKSNHGYHPNLESKEKSVSEYNGSLEKLKSYGMLFSSLNGALEPGINWSKITFFTISEFGREFVKYCLENCKDKITAQ